VARSRRESFLELTLQRMGCQLVRSLLLRKGLDQRLPMLAGYNVDVAEEVLPVGVLVALTFHEGTLVCLLPPNQAHNRIIAPRLGTGAANRSRSVPVSPFVGTATPACVFAG
jgi:hypothetical protein